MDVFQKKPPRTQLSREISLLARGAFDHFRHCSGGIFRLILAEQDHLSLWVPVFIGMGIALYFSLGGEPYLGWSLSFLGVALACSFMMRNKGGSVHFAIALTCVALGVVAAQVRSMSVAAPSLRDETVGAQLEGQVLSASGDRQGGTRLLIAPTLIGELDLNNLPAQVRLKVRQEHAELWPGDNISVRVMLWPPAEPVAPGAFDFARQSWFRQLGATGITLSSPVIHHSDERTPWTVVQNHLREKVTRRVIAAMSRETGPVAAAMMTGQRHAISEDVEQNLRDAGLAHILAISGLHMALFAGTLFWLVRAGLSLVPRLALRYPLKKWAAAIALLGAFSYLLLSGMSVTAQRAFIMAALMFLAILIDRPAISLRNVALAAVLILLTKPESLLEPGFQMSFAAVTALIAVYQNRELQLLRFREKATGLSGVAKFALIYVATLALTSLVAGTATAPFAAFHFNRFAVYGIVGNLLAMPLVGMVIMPAALIAYLLMPLGLEAPALWVMDFGLSVVLAIAKEVSSWEGAIVYAPSFSVTALALVTLGGLCLALLRTKLRYAGCLAIVAGLVLSNSSQPPDILVEGDAKLVAVRLQEGTYAWSGVTPKYARETWLRRSGYAPDTDVGNQLMMCDEVGCVARGRVAVALARTAAAIMDDCSRADVLIAFIPIRGALRRACEAQLIIDRFDIARNGAHAIYLNPDDPSQIERVETVREWRGVRPWTAYASEP